MALDVSAVSIPVSSVIEGIVKQNQGQKQRQHSNYQPNCRHTWHNYRRNSTANCTKQFNTPSSLNVDGTTVQNVAVANFSSSSSDLSLGLGTGSNNKDGDSRHRAYPRTMSSSSMDSNSTGLFSVNSNNSSLSQVERGYTDEENEGVSAASQEDLGDFTLSKAQSPQIVIIPRDTTPVNKLAVLPHNHTSSTPNLPASKNVRSPFLSPSPAPFYSPQLPSQKYRFHKTTSHRLHLQHPAEDLDFKDLDALLWNVPMIHPSIETDTFSKIHSSNKLWDDSELPPTSIPGVGPTNASSFDLEQIHATSMNLSLVYTDTELDMAKKRLKAREEASKELSLEWKSLSDIGLEDLRLVSRDKVQLASGSGRPSWLPPKDPSERRRHSREMFMAINAASESMLAKGEARRERHARDKANDECVHKLLLLLDNQDQDQNQDAGLKVLDELKKCVWETPFSNAYRCEAYERLLRADMEFIKRSGGHVHESFSRLMKLLDEVKLPSNIEQEIKQRIPRTIHDKNMLSEDIKEDLALLLKLKSLSAQGLVQGDTLLFYHLLLANKMSVHKMSLEEVWSLEYAIQLVCFGEVVRQKYNEEILDERLVVQRQLRKCSGFEEENNGDCLNFNTWWNILERVDHQLFMWILDIVVVHNGHNKKATSTTETSVSQLSSWETYRDAKLVNNSKILLSLALNVLLNYHFGFNDLKSLKDLDDCSFAIPLPLSVAMEDPEESYEANASLIKKWAAILEQF